MKRRFLCLILTLVLAVGILPGSAAADEAALQYRNLMWDSETDKLYENAEWPILPLTPTALGNMGAVLSIRPYYNGLPLDCVNGELTSSNDNILSVGKISAAMAKDGKPYFEVELKGVGSATLTYQNQTENQKYTVSVEIGLPDGLYGAQEMTEGNYLADDFCIGDYQFVWYITADGLTKEQADGAVVTAKQDGETDMPVTVTPVLKANSTDRYDLKIDVDTTYGVPHGWIEYSVTLPDSWRTYFKMGRFDRKQQAAWAGENDQYMIFFNDRPNSGGATTLESNGTNVSTVYGQGTSMTQTLTVSAYTWSSNNKAYVPVPDGLVKLIPQEIWIDAAPYFGNANFLSLEAGGTRAASLTGDSLPTTKPNGTFKFDVYGLTGYQNTGNVCATVEVYTVNNSAETYLDTVTIRMPYRGRVVYEHKYEMSENDSVNDKLNQIAKEAVPGCSYTLKLAKEHYTGAIIIPEEFTLQTQRLYIVGQEGTVVEHINLNGSYLYGLENVDFKAPDSTSDPALYNGYCLRAEKCSFRGYNVACDSRASGYITPFNCLFVDNKVAIQVDIKDTTSNLNITGGDHNMFVDNETAIQVKSLHEKNGLDPYHFRVEDCNFIDNDTDFDIQAPGRFYFYRNFYGKWANTHAGRYDELPHAIYKDNNEKIVQYRAPKVKGQDSDTKIITNFRWQYPVEEVLTANAHIGSFMANNTPVSLLREAEGDESEIVTADGTPNVNALTADWENSTVILNEKADILTVSEDVFPDTGSVEIPVLDEQEQTLGTWTFE